MQRSRWLALGLVMSSWSCSGLFPVLDVDASGLGTSDAMSGSQPPDAGPAEVDATTLPPPGTPGEQPGADAEPPAQPDDEGEPDDEQVDADAGPAPDNGDGAIVAVDSATDAMPEPDATPPAPSCSGKAGAKRGKSTQAVNVGGSRRSFVYYAPKNLDPNRPVPLVIVPHGYTQSGEEMFQITKYPAIAEREGFVAMFPDGAPLSIGPWDVGSGVCGNGTFVPGSGDDQAFIDAMIAFASADQCIHRDHIFMTGWSMGGYLSHHTGCLRDDIRAIGPHSGGTHDLRKCKGRLKPVIMFHFDPDGLIDYSCGTKARDSWVERNGCQRSQPEIQRVKGGQCEYYRGCAPGAQVAFCTFQIPLNHRLDFLAGHAWSGGNAQGWSIAETESAAELGWQFFKTYAW